MSNETDRGRAGHKLTEQNDPIRSEIVKSIMFGVERPVAAFRRWRGFSLIDLADRAGVQVMSVRDLEHGGNRATTDEVTRVADALGVDVDDLI